MADRAAKRLSGNKVVRRRLNATTTIPIPEEPRRRPVPHARTRAKRFVGAFTLLVILGAALLVLPWTTESGKATPPIDAIFTAISAGSVTGLMIHDTQDHWNLAGEIVILLLVQAGGLGFMVGASLVLASIGRGISLQDSLMMQDGSPTLSLNEATDLSRRILRYILLCEAIGAVALTLRFLATKSPAEAAWHGVFYSVSSFCNAGMDLEGDYRSFTGYADSVWVNFTVILLLQAGAISFMVVSDVWNKRSWRALTLDTKLIAVTNGALLLSGALAFTALEWNNAMTHLDTWSRPMAGLFQSAAARGGGLATVPFGDLEPPTIFLWVGIMMIGGAAGSTAGGIKMATLAVIAIAVISTIRGQPEAQAFGRRISPQLVFRAMAIVALFLVTHFVLTLCLAISEDVFGNREFGFLPIMLETMSAMATVGLSTGITPDLTTAGKIILCVGMFFGRLGPLTAVYALQRRQRPPRYRFAEAAIRLG